MPSFGRLTNYQQKVVADIVVDLFPHGIADLNAFLIGARFPRLHVLANVNSRFDLTVVGLVEELYSKGNLDQFITSLLSAFPNAPALSGLNDALYVLGPAQSEQRVARSLPGGFEALVSGNGLFPPIDWAKRLLELSRCVCQISVGRDEATARRGTGILVAPDTVLTAFHVVEELFAPGADAGSVNIVFDRTSSDASVTPDGIRSIFLLSEDWKGPASAHKLGILDRQPSALLDFSFLKLSESITDRTPVDLDIVPESNGVVVVIQHPAGGPQRLSIGCVLDEADDKRIRYDADTLPGSSGGLVVTSELKPLAIHHYGSRSQGFNQGVPFEEIKRALRERGE